MMSLLLSQPDEQFSLPTIFKFVYHLVENLRTLHEMGFVHSDLKLENILIGKHDPNNIYLIDFGLARPYRDPESLEHTKK